MRQSLVPLLCTLLFVNCGDSGPADQTSASGSSAATEAPNPNKNAYFGDLHVHTRYSFDAFIFGTMAGPDDAYKFAKGETIKHPGGMDLKLDRPLDFQAVTDHGMYLGMLPGMLDPDSPAFEHPEAEAVRAAKTATERRARFVGMRPYLGSPEHLNMDVVRGAWSEIVAAAERHNDPGKFTAFIGYEFTSAGENRDNLHRNVIFRGSKHPPAPFSRIDSKNPEDLWQAMDGWRAEGIDALAIPHNSNGSGGRMFETERYYGSGAIDNDYAEQRSRNEPLVEMTQVKGTSDTHPALSPNDEWANFEIMPYKVATTILSEPAGSYVRDAYLRGLKIADAGVKNPYKFGLIGSSDTHVAAGSFEEDNYWSKVGLLDESPMLRGSVPGGGTNITGGDPSANSASSDRTQDGSGRTYRDTYYHTWGASGLAGVWAEENTREAIFQAMRRKETFATSGPRMRVRFFGGAALADADLEDSKFISDAYANAVAMGSDYPANDEGAPTFAVLAVRDPMAAPLQRVQIIKGWSKNGETQEKVYDVACSDGASVNPTSHRCPDNGASVDMATCAISSEVGASELKTVWTDPEFDAALRAVYYARVLENPTCRWSTWDAIREGVKPRQDMPATIQERAWSSPIWYNPR
jgi:hypothetical protein